MNFILLCILSQLFIWHPVYGKVYEDRPKIKTSNGHLVIEPAENRNIYLRPNGPKSSIYFGYVDIMKVNITKPQQVLYKTAKFKKDIENLTNRILIIENDLHNKNISSTLSEPGTPESFTVFMRKSLKSFKTKIRKIINKNNCQSNPCMNGGTCLSLLNDYHCLCPKHWEGTNCDEDVDECRNFAGTDLGCQNGAICNNKPGSYECICKPDWYGVHCHKKSLDCSSGNYEMCGHGTCIPTTSGKGIKCICDQGWTHNDTSLACLIDIDECELGQRALCSVNPKAKCINLPGSFTCGPCPPGYEGDGYVCTDIDECISELNGGCSTSPMVPCYNTQGSRFCGQCPIGYLGDGVTCEWRGSCSVNRGGCHPSADCVDNTAVGGSLAQCICPQGMEGDGVGLSGCYVASNVSLGCQNNPCGINGKCHQLLRGYTCFCNKGFTGAYCNIPLDFCQESPCRNGGICKRDDTDIKGFKCECTAQYTGDLCQEKTSACGGYLSNIAGSLVYPLNNNTKFFDVHACAWIIETSHDKVINVTFSKFKLQKNTECSNEFLQIHDGRSTASQLIGRFCGKDYPKGGNIISTHNSLYLWFRSVSHLSGEFALHWNSVNPECGGDIRNQSYGLIVSPGYPGNYPRNRDCFWHLYVSPDKRIKLIFHDFDIESHSNCSNDYLAIYEGFDTTGTLLNKFCNSTHPDPLFSTGSQLTFHFHSDASSVGKGFQMFFVSESGIPGCGGLYTEEKGEISSPSYDNEYLYNVMCEYEIKAPQGSMVKLKFKSFSLEKSEQCEFDYLKLYDGPTADSRLVGKFCGTQVPLSYTSTTNSMFIVFKSDNSFNYEGFKLTYQMICHKIIRGDSGVIYSPGYPFKYPDKIICEYIISTDPGKAIILSFQDFDVEKKYLLYARCHNDYVEIRDGHDGNSTLVGRYCGNTIPPVLTSSLNYLYLKFKTDYSSSGTGFYANFTTINVECGGIFKENDGVINFPSDSSTLYKRNQSCTWYLAAPFGQYININWTRFNLEINRHCSADFVEIEEMDDQGNYNSIGKYCGRNIPPSIATFTKQLKITFKSDTSIESDGFSLNYIFLKNSLHCSVNLQKPKGSIFSPGWPNHYDPNQECSWVIRAPKGHQIKLNVISFGVQFMDKCNAADYLELRNGASEMAPLIGIYCGNSIPKRFTSLSNAFFIRFISDSAISNVGFHIDWESTIEGCGGTLNQYEGHITSPNFPENYYALSQCYYRIVTSHGSIISMNFEDLELDITFDCRDDYVEIYDGRDADSKSLGRFCSRTHANQTIITSSNQAFIVFHSDIAIQAKGFSLKYNTSCQNITFNGSNGIIESPGFPNRYPTNLNCHWNIKVPKGNTINATFTDFDLQLFNYWSYGRISLCETEYVRIVDPTRSNRTICGRNSSLETISTHKNTLEIDFVTNEISFVIHTGFRLEWTKVGCGGKFIKSYGTISYDSSKNLYEEIECEWLIEVPSGNNIGIKFYNIVMKQTNNCSTDAIELYTGENEEFPLLSKVCNDMSSTSNAMSNVMLVRFVKKSDLRDVRFKANFFTVKSKCGGIMTVQSGIIRSPNYPRNYDNDIDCTWILTVAPNHRIKLDINDFDLYSTIDEENRSQCEDKLFIYNSANTLQSNIYQTMCPQSNITQVISESNILSIRFTTDGKHNAKGFKISFISICGGKIQVTKPDIISIKNLGVWSDNCTWILEAPTLEEKVSITFSHIHVQKRSNPNSGRHCPDSYIKVLEGRGKNALLIGEYCDNILPPTIISRGSVLTLQLGTYQSGHPIEGIFTARYSNLDNDCGGTLNSEGYLASPNYPLSYPRSSVCEWTLATSPGNQVFFTFLQFDLTESENCNEDYFEIRETNYAGRLIGVFCGHNLPFNTTTISTSLYLRFHSDTTEPGNGFLIRYGFIHGNDILGLESGVVASPLYPYPYIGGGEYEWRITLNTSKPIIIDMEDLEIPNSVAVCANHLTIYDGYDSEATILKHLCGLMNSNMEAISTSSSIAFIKLQLDDSNIGSKFKLKWRQSNLVDNADISNCGNNHVLTVFPNSSLEIKSPNYPNNYPNDLKCEWSYETTPGRHLKLKFQDISLEKSDTCIIDYISVLTLGENSKDWKYLANNICLQDDKKTIYVGSNRLKVKFVTDSSIGNKGFIGKISSSCGGTVMGKRGTIGLIWEDFKLYEPIKCNWSVKVRPGHTMKLSFDHFNITNNVKFCTNFVTLYNGESIESPLLGSGKYCGYDHEIKEDIVASSNSLFVKVELNGIVFQNFKISYEEEAIECSHTIDINDDHIWEVISSPNYPNIPNQYSECEWVVKCPRGELLRIDFMDRFDLEPDEECRKESLEIHDGYTGLSTLKSILCHDRPGTIKSSSNSLYLKYMTSIPEPRNGFKANISLDYCGGTIYGRTGEIKSPSYPHWHQMTAGTVCEWSVIGDIRGYTYSITLHDLNLPETQEACGTKLDIIEANDAFSEETILNSFCSNQYHLVDQITVNIVTSSNKFKIRLHVGKHADWANIFPSRGFRIEYNYLMKSCFDSVKISEGYLMSPGYPRSTDLRFCEWKIEIPDKSKRIRLEILDCNMSFNHTRLLAYNDLHAQTEIVALNSLSNDTSYQPLVIQSSGNKMLLSLSFLQKNGLNRFKAKFSSDEPASCGGALFGITGEVRSPDLDRSYYCEWNYVKYNTFELDYIYKTILLTGTIVSSFPSSTNLCQYTDSHLDIESEISDSSGYDFRRKLCINKEINVMIPVPSFTLKAYKRNSKPLTFHLNYKTQPCGGIVHVNSNYSVLNIPKNLTESVSCAWILVTDPDTRIDVNVDGTFTSSCSEEYFQLQNSIDERSTVFGNYCRDSRKEDKKISVNYRHIYASYYNKYNSSGITVTVKISNQNQCGGKLYSYQYIFTSPNYPKQYYPNQECIWEIVSDVGTRVELQFFDRFVIEKVDNCTKDAVILYDWKNDDYVEIAKLCGREMPQVFYSTKHRMKVVFRTDASVNMDGFTATWVPICSTNITVVDEEQFIYSPGFPNAYNRNLYCVYNINAPNKYITLKFLAFDVEGDYPSCNFDNLTISANKNDQFEFTYCGDSIPSTKIIYNNFEMVFKTDQYLQKRGYKISLSPYKCGGNITEATVIMIGNEDYLKNTNCTWSIEAPSNKIIIFKLEYISIENSMNCFADSLSLYNGKIINDDYRIARLCGVFNSSSHFRSKENNAVVNFVTDYSLRYNGFKIGVYFSYGESSGCGGVLDLSKTSSVTLKSPLIGGKNIYEPYLDCNWEIIATSDKVIKIEFISFHIASCIDVNQTALEYSNCNCDYVEVKDGVHPSSTPVGTYCGHNLPPITISSGNSFSVRLFTDGEFNSAGFDARISTLRSQCGHPSYLVSQTNQILKTPGYDVGNIPRGVTCRYILNNEDEDYSEIHLRIKDLDLTPMNNETNTCETDKLIIRNTIPTYDDTSKILKYDASGINDFLINENDAVLNYTETLYLCGKKESIDLYVRGNIELLLTTSGATNEIAHRGALIEFSFGTDCNRNLTEIQGRIRKLDSSMDDNDCYIYITAPEGYTISLYIISINLYGDSPDQKYLEVFDGNSNHAARLTKKVDSDTTPVFSSDRNMLLFMKSEYEWEMDFNYVMTNKGRGCGGYLHNIKGTVTSPFYPSVYRTENSCEWELETPPGTKLNLYFPTFDLGNVCEYNYLQLVERNGKIYSQYCDEKPAVYRGNDNYIKIVYKTNRNNSGTGWVANFIGSL